MKKTLLVASVSLCGLAALAWANTGPEITVKHDDNADFSNYRTFGVVESGPPLSANAAPRTGGRSQANDARRLDQGEQAIRDTILEALKGVNATLLAVAGALGIILIVAWWKTRHHPAEPASGDGGER